MPGVRGLVDPGSQLLLAGFPLTYRVQDEGSYSSYGFGGFGAGTLAPITSPGSGTASGQP